MIVVDEREPKSYHSLGDEVKTLETGDYLVIGEGKKYAIERKSVKDLVYSVKGKNARLWTQLARLNKLRDEEKYRLLLVVEGNLEELYEVKKRFIRLPKTKGWKFIGEKAVCTPNWWRGVQIGVASWGVTIIRVANKTEFKELLEVLKERVGESRGYTDNHKPVGMNKNQAMHYLLCSIPNLGPKQASKALEKYGTPSTFFEMYQYADWLDKDEVEGIKLAVYGIEPST